MYDSWPDQFISWPPYLAYPTPLGRGDLAVPNEQSIHWPQAQFAPLYLPAGSASFQPYRYKDGAPMGYARARYNDGSDPASADAVVTQLLDTPPEVPTEVVVAAATAPAAPSPVVPVASEEVAAVVAAADVPFVAFPPELLEGLRSRRVEQLQKLEQTITKLSAMQRGPALDAVYQRLLKIHDRVGDALEKRLEKRKKHPKARRFLRLHRARKSALRFRRRDVGGHGIADARQDLAQLHQVREAYHSGKISREQAERLARVAVKS